MKSILISLCVLCASVVNSVAAAQPNIVFFFVDDMGSQDTSEPFWKEKTKLNQLYHTPNIELLADRGMKFTQAYACAICSPSRISLMTGMNAARHRVTTWTLQKDKGPDRGHATMQAPAWNLNGMCMAPGTPRALVATTLPALLQKAGYRTIHVGKAHFGAKGTPGEEPKNLGFDVNIAGHARGGPGSYHGKNNYSAAFRKGSRVWDVPGLEKYHGTDVNLTEALTLEANRAMDAAVKAGKPFYLYLSHYAIHAPFEKDARFIDKYLKAGLKGRGAVFASMIEGMDKSLGDVIANLKRHGIADNTIVVFMSDNGSPPGMPPNLPLRGRKGQPYEGGIRVPLIVDWPGVTKASTICDRYVIIEDVFPTVLAMAGVKKFTQSAGPIDGVSFVPMLSGVHNKKQTRPIYWHFPNTSNGQSPYSSIRQGDWKLIYNHATRKRELFNLSDDLGERTNLAAENPAKARALAGQLAAFLRETNAQMPTDKRTGKPVPLPDAPNPLP